MRRGVPVVAKHRDLRMENIAKYLLQRKVDIVGLQEIWASEDYELLCNLLASVYPYPYFFRRYFLVLEYLSIYHTIPLCSGVTGSGLAVFSRYPIIEVSCRRFSINGKPQRIFHGDYYGGKAVGLCRIRHPGGIVDFYNTHLIACYTLESAKDEYAAHRVGQSWEIMRFIRHTARNHVVVVGDFNSDPSSLGYRLLTTPLQRFGGGGLVDTFKETMQHEEKRLLMKQQVCLEIGLPFAETGNLDTRRLSAAASARLPRTSKEAIYLDCLRGDTSMAVSNSFTPSSGKWPAERIDYIHYIPTQQIQCLYTRLAMVTRIGDMQCSYSDHYGLMSVFSLLEPPSDPLPKEPPFALQDFYPDHGDVASSPYLRSSPTTLETPPALDSPVQMDSFKNVIELEILPSAIRMLTWGIRDARYRMHLHYVIMYVFVTITCLGLFGGLICTMVPWGNTDAVLVWRLLWAATLLMAFVGIGVTFYQGSLVLLSLPDELSALERIRSEIIVWVRGHAAFYYPDESPPQYEIPVGNDALAVLDAKMVKSVLLLAGLSVKEQDVGGTTADSVPPPPQQVGPYTKVATTESPPAATEQHASTIPRSTSFSGTARPAILRVSQHSRKLSDMSNPGPRKVPQDLVAINALSGTFRFGSSDHPVTSVADSVGEAFQELRTQTQRAVENTMSLGRRPDVSLASTRNSGRTGRQSAAHGQVMEDESNEEEEQQ